MKTKTALTTSILLNFCLAAGLLFFWMNGHQPAPVEPPIESGASAALPVGNVEPIERLEGKPSFEWSHLESTNYSIYIANLRSIKCPEQTIRDLIGADVHSIYGSREEELERKLAASMHEPFSVRINLEPRLNSELQELRNEEAALVSGLMGIQTDSEKTLTAQAPVSSQPHLKKQEPTVTLPLVLQNIDPANLKLNSRQKVLIDELRQHFLNEIGDQDPNDPAYRDRWLKAQPEVDDQLRTVIGINAWQDLQIQAAAEQRQSSGTFHGP